MVVLLVATSVPQRLVVQQHVLDAILRLRLAAQREECLALEVEDDLLGDRVADRGVATAQDVAHVGGDLLVVRRDLVGDLAGCAEHLDRRQALATRDDEGLRQRRPVALLGERDRHPLGGPQLAVAVEFDVVEWAEVADFAGFLGGGADLGHGDGLEGAAQEREVRGSAPRCW